MTFYTADSYKNYERVGEPFEKEGKLYIKVKGECPRCSGKGIIAARVENGHIVPIPVANGICFACAGAKYITKEVRLYTEKEYNAMNRSKERAAEKRKAEQEQRMKENYAHKKEVWLQTNGFSADGVTYIVIGDSYSIKDELKEAGFHFNGGLRRWMRGSAEGYEDKVIKFNLEDLFEISAWGEGHPLKEAKAKVDAAEAAILQTKPSEWIGEVGKRIPATQVTLKRTYYYENQYGVNTVYTFETESGSVITWFTKVDINKENGDVFTIVGTVKDHSTYNNQKQTVLTRVKVVEG